MAIQYYMRAYNTSTLQYVDWVVNDTPDATGIYAPGGNAHLTNIVVNQSVQSKVQNFLKPVVEPTYITNVSYNNPQDGYLFHLNSYDWLNPVISTGPITIPSLTQPIGISIVRGSASSGQPFTPSNYASLFWEEGTQNWNFAFINSNGSIGNPLAVSMGTAIIDGYALVDGYLAVVPNLTVQAALSGSIRLANNQSIVARNAANTADLITLGTDSINNTIVGNAVQNVIIGGTAANIIGLPSSNTTTIAGNLLVLGNSTTVESTTVDIVGRVIHGNYSTAANVPPPSLIAGYSVHRGAGATNQNDGSALIWIEGSNTVTGSDGYWLTATITQDIDILPYGTQSALPNIVKMMTGAVYVAANPQPGLTTLPTVGGLRTQNATTAVASRNAASSANLLLLGTDSGNHIIIGDTTNAGQIFDISTGSIYNFEVNGVSTYTLTPISSGVTTLQAVSTVTGVVYSQATGATGTGAPTTLQAQNITTGTGGLLNLTSGSGTVANGVINFQPGGATALALSATGSTLHWVNTITSPLLSQDNNTTNSATAQTLTVQAQNATGTTSTGGALVLTSGTGTTTAGNVGIQTGGVTRVAINPTFTTFNDTAAALKITPVSAGTTQITYSSTVTAAQINQAATGGATGATMTVQAQNALTTGGGLNLTSGTGVTAGNVNLQTGGVTNVAVNPTFTTFNDSGGTVSYTVTPISAGTTTLQAASTVTAVVYNQALAATGPGAPTTLQSQGVTTGTGGALNLSSGTGSTAGNVRIQAGGTTIISVHPSSILFNDSGGTLTYTITPSSSGATTFQAAAGVGSVTYSQADMTSTGVSATTTLQAQSVTASNSTGGILLLSGGNATGSLGIGGNLVITSGTGTILDGYIDLQTGGVSVATVEPNKFVFNQGTRRNVTSVTVDGYMDGYYYYQVQVTDDLVAISALSAPLTVILPLNPVLGDTYEIKDATGLAATYPITVDGNGVNIDDPTTPAIVLSNAYGDLVVTYTGTSWSVTSYYFEGIS